MFGKLQEMYKDLIFPLDEQETPLFVEALKSCLFGDCSVLKEEVRKILNGSQINKRVIEIDSINELEPIFVYPYNKVMDLAKKEGQYKIVLFIYERMPFYNFILDKVTSEIGKFVYEKIKDLPLLEAYKWSKSFPYVTITRSVMRDMLPTLKVSNQEIKDDFEENYDVAEISLQSGNYDDEIPDFEKVEEFFGISLNEEQKRQAELDKIIEILNELDELEEEIDSP